MSSGIKFAKFRSNTNATVVYVNSILMHSDRYAICGPVAQWIRYLTTNQGIPGSNPGGVVCFS